jgi:hypothetical protein
MVHLYRQIRFECSAYTFVLNLKWRYSPAERGEVGRRGRRLPVRGPAGEGASLGRWWASLPRVTAPVCDDFGIPGFQFAVPHHPTHVSLPTPPVFPWTVRKSDGSSGASVRTSVRLWHCRIYGIRNMARCGHEFIRRQMGIPINRCVYLSMTQ